jgi:hypothetical protein
MRKWAKGLGYQHQLISIIDEFIGSPEYKEVLNGTKYRFKSIFAFAEIPCSLLQG